MDLKDNYINLPVFITKCVTYDSVKQYVFAGGKFPQELQRMLDEKTPGYSRSLSIIRAKELSQEYGCNNEKELLEAGQKDLALKMKSFGRFGDASRECWQNGDLN